MTKKQAVALLSLIADLNIIINTPDIPPPPPPPPAPEPPKEPVAKEPVPNGRSKVREAREVQPVAAD